MGDYIENMVLKMKTHGTKVALNALGGCAGKAWDVSDAYKVIADSLRMVFPRHCLEIDELCSILNDAAEHGGGQGCPSVIPRIRQLVSGVPYNCTEKELKLLGCLDNI